MASVEEHEANPLCQIGHVHWVPCRPQPDTAPACAICACPEDNDVHDPLGPVGAHPFNRMPDTAPEGPWTVDGYKVNGPDGVIDCTVNGYAANPALARRVAAALNRADASPTEGNPE